MNLSNYEQYRTLDKQNMLAHINGLPDQLWKAWELGKNKELPQWQDIRQVVIAGMGGSAIGADLLAGYVQSSCNVPVYIHRDYDLPAWARGPDTLVIASSHSGNTEETLSAYETAHANRCRSLAICTGGKLAQMAREANSPLWIFEYHGQPRAAVGYSFGLLLAVMTHLHFLENPEQELHDAIRAMRVQQEKIAAEIPPAQNLAKRLAGQLVGRWVTVIGSGILAPVARRWKGQISEIAKAWAQFEFLPEANHNTLAGILNPEELFAKTMIFFLNSRNDHPRNRKRSELTRQIFMLEGLNTDNIEASGETPLANLWTCLHLGDYVAYYLAMAYDVDPTPVDVIEGFKKELG